jgi:hypothetical protein
LGSDVVKTQSVTIGGGLEFSGIAGYLVFDFSNSALSANTLTVTVNGAPNNYIFPSTLGKFVFSKFADTINDVVLFSDEPKFNNFTASDFSFDAHTLTLDFSGVKPQNGQSKLVFNITSGLASPAAAAPEPATVALLGLGLLGVAASRRKGGKNTKA